MEPAVATTTIFRFGLFEADPVRSTLTRNGIRVKIQDQPFRVLILLLQSPGDTVSREVLRQKLWPEGTYVDFDGSLNVILKKLRAAIGDDPDNPRFVETVPRRGYRFIAPVAIQDRKTEATATPVVASAITGTPVAESISQRSGIANTGLPAVRPYPPARPLVMYSAYALGLLIVAAGGWYVSHGRVSQSQPASSLSQTTPPVQMRKSVAVLGFHGLSVQGEDAWLATALSEMLSTELASGEKLRLISGEDVANLRISSPWSQTDTLDQGSTARIGSALSGDLLVLGSYTTLGKPERGQVRLDVRLQDAKTGEILTEVAEIGSTQELFQMVSRVGGKLRDRIGVPRPQDPDEAGVLASLPRDREAARFYALGVARLRQFDPLGAKDLLQEAVQIEPKFPVGHAMLAEAWSQLGYGQKRRDEAKKALDLSADLPRAERMLVEGEYYESLGNQEQAESIYHALFELFPDDLDYGLHLAMAQNLAGHGSQALETLHRLRNLPLPSSADPRIDLTESRAIKNNLPTSLVLIRSAITKATTQGKKLLFAQARKEECMLLEYSDHPEQAMPACEEAYEIYVAAGNRAGAADSVRLLADNIGSQGHLERAIATYQRALNILEGTGEHQKTGAIQNNMAVDLANEGKLDRSEQLYRQAKFHFEQAGDKPNTATAQSNIADVLYLKGNLPGADKIYRQNLEFVATIDHGEPGYALYRLADLKLAQGKIKEAKALAQQAIDALRPSQGAYQYLTGAMIVMGEALKNEGDLQSARQQFQDTLVMRQKMGGVDLVEESQVEIAQLDLEEGHAEQAEPLLRAAITQFEKEQSDPDSASAYTVLARALLMQGKLEARAAAQHAVALTRNSSDPALRLPAAIQDARVAFAGSQPANANSVGAARQELLSALATAKKLGYYNIECEAQLAQGELDLKLNSRSGRPKLAALAKDFRDHGFELLARQAEKAIAATPDVLAVNKTAR